MAVTMQRFLSFLSSEICNMITVFLNVISQVHETVDYLFPCFGEHNAESSIELVRASGNQICCTFSCLQ